jgi:sarcosine oxidase
MPPVSTTADVIIVGGGLMGSAAAYHLAGDGRRVVVLERFGPGHAMGSSHGDSRIIRLAYDAPEYVALARDAYRQWGELAAAVGGRLMVRTGGLDIGGPDAEVIPEIRATYEAADIPYEALDKREIEERYPQFSLPEGTVGLWQADYALLAADACVGALQRESARRGAAFRFYEPALTIRRNGAGVEVETAHAAYAADRAILAAGSWMGPLLRGLGLDLPLTVRKEQVAYFAARHPEWFTPDRFPLVIHRFPGNYRLGSFFPSFGHEGVKALIDREGPIVADPDHPDRAVDQPYLDRLLTYAPAMVPDLTGEVLWAGTCRYTMTPDEDFLLDRHPEHPQLVLASPCSGHGFKFGPTIGRILADLATGRVPAFDIARFRLDRPALRPPIAAWPGLALRPQPTVPCRSQRETPPPPNRDEGANGGAARASGEL